MKRLLKIKGQPMIRNQEMKTRKKEKMKKRELKKRRNKKPVAHLTRRKMARVGTRSILDLCLCRVTRNVASRKPKKLSSKSNSQSL